jgi:hypothetical protein
MGDVAFGACCVDDYSAAALGAPPAAATGRRESAGRRTHQEAPPSSPRSPRDNHKQLAPSSLTCPLRCRLPGALRPQLPGPCGRDGRAQHVCVCGHQDGHGTPAGLRQVTHCGGGGGERPPPHSLWQADRMGGGGGLCAPACLAQLPTPVPGSAPHTCAWLSSPHLCLQADVPARHAAGAGRHDPVCLFGAGRTNRAARLLP